tara:strand:+ start:799 stop:990 length:192 start_codon:yes stop_codon:yes gene_type:complete
MSDLERARGRRNQKTKQKSKEEVRFAVDTQKIQRLEEEGSRRRKQGRQGDQTQLEIVMSLMNK